MSHNAAIPPWIGKCLSAFIWSLIGIGAFKFYGRYCDKQEREASLKRIKDDPLIKVSPSRRLKMQGKNIKATRVNHFRSYLLFT